MTESTESSDELRVESAGTGDGEVRSGSDGGPPGVRGLFGSTARARPVATFFLLAFAYSWGAFVLLYALVGTETITGSRLWQVPFAWGPPIAAVLVVWLRGEAVREWLWTVADPRTGIRWYVLAVVVAVLFADLGALVAALAGARVELAAPATEIAASFLTTLLVAGALEEFGWRGFVQPRLQERYGALSAAVVVGVAWGLWHLPFVFLGGAGYDGGGIGAVAGITVFGVLMSVILAWLFNGSAGTVPVAMVAHATINAGSILEPVGEVTGPVSGGVAGLLLWVALIGVLVVAYGREYLAPRGPDVAVLGRVSAETGRGD